MLCVAWPDVPAATPVAAITAAPPVRPPTVEVSKYRIQILEFTGYTSLGLAEGRFIPCMYLGGESVINLNQSAMSHYVLPRTTGMTIT